MSERKVTTDHETIRRWVEERGGKPATVRGTGGGEGEAASSSWFAGKLRRMLPSADGVQGGR